MQLPLQALTNGVADFPVMSKRAKRALKSLPHPLQNQIGTRKARPIDQGT